MVNVIKVKGGTNTSNKRSDRSIPVVQGLLFAPEVQKHQVVQRLFLSAVPTHLVIAFSG